MNSVKYCSKSVYSDQVGIHEDLSKLVKKFQRLAYLKPVSESVLLEGIETIRWIQDAGNPGVILDMGCGTGESTNYLAKKYPENLIIGIDKSKDRIFRKNTFKKEMPSNMRLILGNIVDWWLFFEKNQDQLNILKQYILYPNPYPKQKHLKLRWHAQPIFKSIANLKSEIEVRSNWRLYVQEFRFALQQYSNNSLADIESINPENYISPFEKKYYLSRQEIFRFKTRKN